ncbi:MAG: VWA domain-containing protein [Oscillochloridaceae bacterium umkhey_bin13]
MNPTNPDYDEIYQAALAHYRRGEINEALTLLEQLEASGNETPESHELLADIRLQLKLTVGTTVAREAPKPARAAPPLALIVGLVALLVLGGGALFWLRPWQAPAVAAVPTETATTTPPPATATVVPATATPEPPTATPEPPTATPVPPTATPLPGAVVPTGELAVRLPPGQEALVRSPRNIAIILDASGSMRGQLGGRVKMDILRDAVMTTVRELPDDTLLAVRTFGNQRSNDCTDLSLLRPLGIHDRNELLGDLEQVIPAVNGMTPAGASLDAIALDLAAAGGFTALLLVSDGEENCDGDPVASAAALSEAFPQLRINVIGFDIGDEVLSGRLREIAEVGRGSYFDASDADALTSALEEAVQLSFTVIDEEGTVRGNGLVGGAPLRLPVGIYRIVLDSDDPVETTVEIIADELTLLQLTPDGNGIERV